MSPKANASAPRASSPKATRESEKNNPHRVSDKENTTRESEKTKTTRASEKDDSTRDASKPAQEPLQEVPKEQPRRDDDEERATIRPRASHSASDSTSSEQKRKGSPLEEDRSSKKSKEAPSAFDVFNAPHARKWAVEPHYKLAVHHGSCAPCAKFAEHVLEGVKDGEQPQLTTALLDFWRKELQGELDRECGRAYDRGRRRGEDDMEAEITRLKEDINYLEKDLELARKEIKGIRKMATDWDGMSSSVPRSPSPGQGKKRKGKEVARDEVTSEVEGRGSVLVTTNDGKVVMQTGEERTPLKGRMDQTRYLVSQGGSNLPMPLGTQGNPHRAGSLWGTIKKSHIEGTAERPSKYNIGSDIWIRLAIEAHDIPLYARSPAQSWIIKTGYRLRLLPPPDRWPQTDVERLALNIKGVPPFVRSTGVTPNNYVIYDRVDLYCWQVLRDSSPTETKGSRDRTRDRRYNTTVMQVLADRSWRSWLTAGTVTDGRGVRPFDLETGDPTDPRQVANHLVICGMAASMLDNEFFECAKRARAFADTAAAASGYSHQASTSQSGVMTALSQSSVPAPEGVTSPSASRPTASGSLLSRVGGSSIGASAPGPSLEGENLLSRVSAIVENEDPDDRINYSVSEDQVSIPEDSS